MTTNTTPTDLKEFPEVHRGGVPSHPAPRQPDSRSGKPKKRGIIWIVLFLAVASVAGYTVWRAGQPTTPQTGNKKGGRKNGGGGGGGAVPVVISKASRSSVPFYLNGLGNVVAFYTVTVKSRVDGQLMKFNLNEGDLVKEGQDLIDIDPRPYQVQLEQAEGTMAHDKALLDDAKLDLERYKGLLATDAIPKQQLDTQVALVAQYEGSIKQDQANIDNAKLQITYAKITSPITGVVGLRQVDPGNIVHAADTTGMILITQLQPIQVQFTIPEDSLPQVVQKLRAGLKLPAEAWNRDNSKKLATGVLVTLDNQIDNTTGTSKLKAVFDNEDNALFPQQFVNIRLLVDTLSNQLVVPPVAVQNGQQGTFVYVVDGDFKVHLRPVQVGITTDKVADIQSGLMDGEQVVVDGTDRLVDGASVRIRPVSQIFEPGSADGGGNRGGRNGKKGGKKGQGGGQGGGKQQ
jgi:membrane fusion protein, multidrug efflux system